MRRISHAWPSRDADAVRAPPSGRRPRHDPAACVGIRYPDRRGERRCPGQRQRIALARALYGDPFLVVLDEPNSNLDKDGEAALRQAIAGVKARGAIVVLIAHRPSELSVCDMIIAANGCAEGLAAMRRRTRGACSAFSRGRQSQIAAILEQPEHRSMRSAPHPQAQPDRARHHRPAHRRRRRLGDHRPIGRRGDCTGHARGRVECEKSSTRPAASSGRSGQRGEVEAGQVVLRLTRYKGHARRGAPQPMN
jgi:ATPase subunit of ABC transporter with duplicated ATPase domains